MLLMLSLSSSFCVVREHDVDAVIIFCVVREHIVDAVAVIIFLCG